MNKELRLIITRKCNYDCYFCHGEGVEKNTKDLLQAEDYQFLVSFCKEKYGWNTVTLTGGEPFMRKDIADIIDKLYDLGISLTVVSNGELINNYYNKLDKINRLNISIHSFDEDIYDKIVQRKNKLPKVKSNLSELRNFNSNIEIRINTTIVKGQNDALKDYKNLLQFAESLNASIKIIELFSNEKKDIVPLEKIKFIFMNLGFKVLQEYDHKIELYNGKTKVILSKIFCAAANNRYNPNTYCNAHNDLFVSPDGKIRLCRYLDEEVDILNEIKNKDINGLNHKMSLANNLLGRHCPLIRTNNELAINGGTPVMDQQQGKFIHPKITSKIEKAVVEQLYDTISIYDRSNIFKIFETEFANYHNKKYGIVTSSGTSALHSMFDAIALKKGDEIICPIYTFFATISPIFQTGAKPIFVDCDSTGNIDYRQIENKITKKTKAIIVTHMWGYPCKMDEIRKIADKYNIYLLEDCSHAHGGRYLEKKLGEWGDAAAFSLQGNKIVTGGEGGIVITNNKYIYKNCVLLGHYNKRCKQEISKNSIDYKYATTGKGLKLRAHPIAIRIAYEMFKDLDKMNYIKTKMVEIIENTVKEIDGIELNKSYEGSYNSYYALIFKYDSTKFNNLSIEKFLEALHAEGGVEFDKPGSTCPLNRLELFKNPQYFYHEYESLLENEEFKKADEFYENSFKLPVWYTEEDMDIVLKYCDILKKVANFYKKEV